jgi:formylglycine-generating enzyme required for sulfatase activity
MKLPLSVALLVLAPLLAAQQPRVVVDSLPGLRMSWELIEVPGGPVVLDGDTVMVDTFLVGRTEVPWELYDIFYLRLDVPRGARDSVDARLRPSRPYGAPDRGFGHRGFPAISVTHGATTRFVTWLSSVTGNEYRVMTEAEWQRAADLAFPGGIVADSVAWTGEVSGGATRRIGSGKPDALGLHDLLGNADEWVTGRDSTPVLRGGSYLDSLVTPGTRRLQEPSWNQTDPQIPKSRWWLSDGPFAGFRIARKP